MSCRVTEPVHFQRTVGVQCCQLDQFADDCCPFSVLVRLIAHGVKGGWKDYRNSNAFKKAEVECVPLRFHGCFFSCNLGRRCWKTSLHVSFVCAFVFVVLSRLTS